PPTQNPPPQNPPPQNPSSRRDALARAVQGLDAAPTSPQAPVQAPAAAPGQVRLIDVSLDIEAAVGGSTEPDSVLDHLQGGGHDPRKRGFTLQQAELWLGGAVDPYFNAEARLVTFIDPIPGDTVVELEEAFATTQSLPADLQLKAGLFLTEFGRMNPTHP